MIRNQGKDATLEPAYFARRYKTQGSESYEARIRRLETLVQEIQDIVDGTASEEYKDGLVYRITELERIVAELDIKDHVLYDTTANWNAQRSL